MSKHPDKADYLPLPTNAAPPPKQPSKLRKFAFPILLASVLGMVAWKGCAYYESMSASHDIVDLSLPEEVMAFQGPRELTAFLKDLQHSFGEYQRRPWRHHPGFGSEFRHGGCHHGSENSFDEHSEHGEPSELGQQGRHGHNGEHGEHGQHGHHGHHGHRGHHGHNGHHGHHDKPDEPTKPTDPNDPAESIEATEAVMPIVAADVTETSEQNNIGDFVAHSGVAFPPEHLRHGAVPRHREPFCKREELTSSSQEFTFSPEQYRRAGVFVDGHFSRGSEIRVVQADTETNDIRVVVTLHAGSDSLTKRVSITGFDHDGQFAVEVKRPRRHRGPPRRGPHSPPPHPDHPEQPDQSDQSDHPDQPDQPDQLDQHDQPSMLTKEAWSFDRPRQPQKERCLVYTVTVLLPSSLSDYDALDLRASSGHITGDLSDVAFGELKAGLGFGVIRFPSVTASNVTLGALHGVVAGHYYGTSSFRAGVINGASTPHVYPEDGPVDVTVGAVAGRASLKLPADGFAGDFSVSSWTGSHVVAAPNPNDVHVTKYTFSTKEGYYKEAETGSRAIVHAKHGNAKLEFQDNTSEEQ